MFLHPARFATPDTAWSQEVLHNATQDLVKVFVRVFTNNIAAGFKATEAKTSRAILGRAGKRESRDRLDLFLPSCSPLSSPSSRSSLGKMRATSPSPLHLPFPPPLQLSPRPLPGSRTSRCPARAPPAPSTASWQGCTGWPARPLCPR